MGIASYNRGSEAIAREIQRPQREVRVREDMVRAAEKAEKAEKAEELEEYCREVLAALVDSAGMVGAMICQTMKDNNRKTQRLHNQYLEAHSLWLDSNEAYPLNHLEICWKKASAAYQYLDHLCSPFKHPVQTPRGINHG